MKKTLSAVLMTVFALGWFAPALALDEFPESKIVISDLSVKGRIEGENIVFNLEFTADVKERGLQIPLAIGDLALFGKSKLPDGAELTRSADRFLLKFSARGKQQVMFQFASRPVKETDWRYTAFSIPMANIRRLLVECDRDDLEIRFPGALKVEKHKNPAGKTEATAFLGVTSKFEVRWKPEVKKLTAETVVECQANTIATASVGAMKLDTIFTYRVVQGSLAVIELAIPKSVNVVQVRGVDIRDWTLEKKEGEGDNKLTVTLSRPKEDTYKLHVESEMVLPAFPCAVVLPLVNPKEVIRTSGFLAVGTDSAIKLLVRSSLGLTQIDQAAYPRDAVEGSNQPRPLPARSAFVYQYANMPYTLQLAADDIVSEYSVDEQMALTLKDNDLTFTVSAEIDVRDAGARELIIETDPAWIAANVTGAEVADYDVREKDGKRLIHIIFKKGVVGRTVIGVVLERAMKDDAGSFDIPAFTVKGAKSERGHLVLAAEEGLRLRAGEVKGMREIHTASTPFQVPGAQLAFRFKEAGWSVSTFVERTKAGLHADLFHLVSIGEGVVYCSSTISYLISGAPVKYFVVYIPKEYQNVEFSGRDVQGWSHEGERWVVRLQEKVSDEYTLGLTYDRQFDYRGGEIAVGSVHVGEVESEMGFIALASSADLKLDEIRKDTTVIQIDADEIPAGYKLALLRDPILRAYKYVNVPHVAAIKVGRRDAEPLLTQVVDLTSLHTTISKEGEIVTTVTYMTKNASEQYLVVKLPKDSKLWSTRLLTEDGTKKEAVPSREVKLADGQIEVLIPIRRPQQLGAPMHVEVVYAESQKMGRLGGMAKLTAPATTRTHSTFVEWTIAVPDDMVVSRTAGNMQLASTRLGRPSDAAFSGPDLVARGIWYVLARPFRHTSGVPFMVGLRSVLKYGEMGANNLTMFSETMALKESDALSVDIGVRPLWFGPGGSFWLTLVLGAVGIVVAVPALARQEKRRWLAALGLTVLLFAACQLAAGRMILTWCGALVVVIAVLAVVLRNVAGAWRLAKTIVVAIATGIWKLTRAIVVAIAVGMWKLTKAIAIPVLRAVLFVIKGLAGLVIGAVHLIGRAVGAFIGGVRHARAHRHTAANDDTPDPDSPPFEAERGVSDVTKDAPSGDATPGQHMAGPASPTQPPADDNRSGAALVRWLAALALAAGITVAGIAASESAEPAPAAPPAAAPAAQAAPAPAASAPAPSAPAVPAAPAPKAPVAPVPPAVLMNSVDILIIGPGTGKDGEKSATIEKTIEFTTQRAVSICVIETPGVMTSYELNTKYASVSSGADGYVLNVTRKGTYKAKFVYLVPVSEVEGDWSLALAMPDNMRNSVQLKLPETGMDISCNEAVHFGRQETETNTTATAVFGPTRQVNFKWRPRVRKTTLEKAVYFCEISTLAMFQPGVVDLTHLIRYQIAQGELKRMEIIVPAEMSVTAVTAKDLSTWRFDPEKHILEAVLERPVAGQLTLKVVCQAACQAQADDVQGAYSARIGALSVAGAARQRGSIAFASPETMQIRVDKTDGLDSMNITDFSPEALTGGPVVQAALKRAYRYHQVPVLAEVHAEPVLPEIRVDQKRAEMSISDERITMSTSLEVTVLKAGVFSLHVNFPHDFDIETLSGDDVSHWDEVEGPDERVIVHFANKVEGVRTINLVLARMERGIEDVIEVPRVTVKDAKKHVGVLRVEGERGVRLTATEREGVSEISPGTDLRYRTHQGVLAFRLLRPTWKIVLKTEVIAPAVKPEVLQRVEVAEGMLRGQAWIAYRIENAGCKTFYVRAPQPGIPMSFNGKNIAKTYEEDKTNGLWRIDLHGKEINLYNLHVSYQIPFNLASNTVAIKPVETVGTDPQKGHLVIMSGGRVQIKPVEEATKGLKAEDPRTIPEDTFHAGDLSDAIYCYRTVRADYTLGLSVQRPDAAKVLPAAVHSVDMSSVVADQRGNMLTRVLMRLDVGNNFRFLEVTLPQNDSRMWTVFVNRHVAEPVREEKIDVSGKKEMVYRIPLEEATADDHELTDVEFIYAEHVAIPSLRCTYTGPKFNLPLNNITWNFFVRRDRRYFGFGGTMSIDKQASGPNHVVVFNEDRYNVISSEEREKNKSLAKANLDKGDAYYRQKGDPRAAKKAYEQAMTFAPNQPDREDARIQYQSVVRQAAKVGLVQQRREMRAQRNMPAGAQGGKLEGFNDGNFTADFAKSVEQSLGSKENEAFDNWVQKVIDQQTAAAGVPQGINIVMPEDGRVLKFMRQILTDPNTPVTARFMRADLSLAGMLWKILWPGLLLIVVVRIVIRQRAEA